MRRIVFAMLCLPVFAIMLAMGYTTAVAAPDREIVQNKVFYNSMPVTLTITSGNATSLERAYEAISTNRPAYAEITSLKIVTENNTAIDLNNLQGEDVLFLKKLMALQKIDLSSAMLYGDTYDIPDGVFTGMANLEEVVLNAGTNTIGNNAFSGCTNLHTINLDKVSSIKEGAFKDCVSLASANTAVLTEIGESAFEGCTSLESINLARLANIEAGAFRNCHSLKTVGNTTALKQVSENAFSGCRQLAEISLANVNSTIGAYAFYDCVKLEKTNSMSLVPAVGRYAFYNCTGLKGADLTSAANLGAYAFYGCTALEEVRTGLSLRTIPTSAFENCGSLKTIDIRRITSIQNSAFKNCKALNNLDFTDTTYIGINAFNNCSGMEKAAVWPSRTANIANNAFKYCAFDFSNGYPANTKINEHSAPAQRPPLVFALAKGADVSYKIGSVIRIEDLYTIKTVLGTDYISLIQGNPAWMGSTLDDIKVSAAIKQDGKDVDSIANNENGIYEVTLSLPGIIGSNTNELKLKVTVSASGGQWKEEGGKKYFYEGSTKKTGWLQDNNNWYYLDNTTGEMKTGWVQVSGKWYLLGNDGVMKTGWQQDGSSWYHLKPSGEMAIGWLMVGGKWYYLKPSGAMQTGWLKLDNKWYYLLPSGGAMVTGKQTIDGKTYNFNSSGVWQR